MNMSKYPSLPISELLPSKMAKLQGLENCLCHTDVREVSWKLEDQVLLLRSKGGIKRFFQIKKGGSLIFLKK